MGTVTSNYRTPRPTAARIAQPNSADRKPWMRIIGLSVAAILLLIASVWAWRYYRHVARLRKAEQLLAAAAQNRPANSGQGSPGQRRFGLNDDTRNAIGALGLSDAERQELWKARQEAARRRREEEMQRFLALSEKDRWAYAQKMAAEMAKRFDQNAAAAKNGQASNSSNGSRGNGPGNNGNANRQGPRGPRTPDQRLQAQKWRLDNTTPQERAARTIYVSQLTSAINQQNNVRLGQGLPPIPLPRGRSS